jgi:hypothetical protein
VGLGLGDGLLVLLGLGLGEEVLLGLLLGLGVELLLGEGLLLGLLEGGGVLSGEVLGLGLRLADELELALGECVRMKALSVAEGLVPHGVCPMPDSRTFVPASAAPTVPPETMQTMANAPSALDVARCILKAKAPPRSVVPRGPDYPCRP